MRYFFACFWGLLCTSAINALLYNASEDQWAKVFFGVIVIAWSGYNSYTWFSRARGT